MKTSDKCISALHAAQMLHVSKATVINWIRSGIIREDENGIVQASIISLKKKIKSGTINKLNFRANKTFSVKKVHPGELENNSRGDDLGIRTVPGDAGIHYQAEKPAGIKSREGSFYTPDFIINDILNDFRPERESKICDPCCGTGKFIKNITGKYKYDLFLYGYDTDRKAVEIARNDLIRHDEKNIEIKTYDSLTNPEDERFDYIFTNPPWGARYSADYKAMLRKIYPGAGSHDSLEYFLLYGFRSVKKNGIISFILPESFLYIRKFRKIRKYLLNNTTIIRIKSYGRIFSQVFSNVIRIDIKKSDPCIGHTIIADKNEILQSYYLSDPDMIFNITQSENDIKLISSIYKKPFVTLKDNAQWSLGIVTGDNKRFIRSEKNSEFCKEVIAGKNIVPYSIIGEIKYLHKDFSMFQQVSKKDHFSVQEKLIYKFISNRLVFAYDNSGIITLNSANILIPQLKNYTVKSVMAILNSDLINFIYRKKFNSLKVLRSHLEQLPFPENPDRKIIHLIDRKTNCIINNGPENGKCRQEIEKLVNKLFGVKNESRTGDPETQIIPGT